MTNRNLWSKEEDSILFNLKKAGMTYAQIAQKLGRSKSAVQQHVSKLKSKGIESKSEPVSETYIQINDDNDIAPIFMRQSDIDKLKTSMCFMAIMKRK